MSNTLRTLLMRYFNCANNTIKLSIMLRKEHILEVFVILFAFRSYCYHY